MNDFSKKAVKRVAVSVLGISTAGLLAITGFEGYSGSAYIPVKGDVPTIGYGHTGADVKLGDTITKEEALDLLEEDTQAAQRAIKSCVKVPLSQNEFDAYTSFAFNVGGGAFCRSTLVKKLNQYDYEGACQELKKWVYSGGVKYQGLVNRRKMETLVCTDGEYPR